MTIIMGHDCGIKNLGVAIYNLEEHKLLMAGSIVADQEHIHDKLVYIDRQFGALLDKHKPNSFTYEHPVFLGRGKNSQEINLVLGIILLHVHKRGIPIYGYTPQVIKKEVAGNSKADKKAVEVGVNKWLGKVYKYESNHASDSVGAILCFLKKEGFLK